MRHRIIATIAIFALNGCAKTVWVSEKDVKNGGEVVSAKGIPFYAKTKVVNQVSKYAQTWAGVTLKVNKTYISENPKEKTPTTSQEFYRKFTKEQLLGLTDIKRDILLLDNGNNETVQEIIKKYLNVPGLNNTDNVQTQLISNTKETEWVVDSSKLYYLNAPLPWFGTNTFSQEINEDGTLSKTSSAPDTKVADGISSLIPFKEFLTGKFVTPLSEEPEDSVSTTFQSIALDDPTFSIQRALNNLTETKFSYEVTIDIQETGFIYTFKRPCNKFTDCAAPIDLNLTTGFFAREAVAVKSPVQTDKDSAKKDESNKISFNGAITLPKEKPATTEVNSK